MEAQSANLASKGRFWSDFGILGGPKNRPLGGIFGQKVDFGLDCRRPEAPLEPTWGRLGAEKAPKRPKNRFFLIFDGFQTNFGKMLVDLSIRRTPPGWRVC